MTDEAVPAAALLRIAAAGRREYADGIPESGSSPVLREMRSTLLTEAGTLEAAARLVEGDLTPLYGWLPTWRWTVAMDRLVLADQSNAVQVADVEELLRGNPRLTGGDDWPSVAEPPAPLTRLSEPQEDSTW